MLTYDIGAGYGRQPRERFVYVDLDLGLNRLAVGFLAHRFAAPIRLGESVVVERRDGGGLR